MRGMIVVLALWLAACAGGPTPRTTVPAEGAGRWIEAGRSALERGEMVRAERWLEQAVRVAPRDPRAWRALADLRQAQGRWEEARRLRLRACRLVGDCP